MTSELRERSVLLLVGNAVGRDGATSDEDRHRRLDEAVCSIARAVLAAHGRLVMPFDPSSSLVVAHIATEYLAPVHAEELGIAGDRERRTDSRLVLLAGRARKPSWVPPLEEVRAVRWSDSSEIATPVAIVVLGKEVARLRVDVWLNRYPSARVAAFGSLAAIRAGRRPRLQTVDGELMSQIQAARKEVHWQREGDESTDREPLRPDYRADPFVLMAQHFVERLSDELDDGPGPEVIGSSSG